MSLIVSGVFIMAVSVTIATAAFGVGLIGIGMGADSIVWGPIITLVFGGSVIGIAVGGLVTFVGMVREPD